MNTNKYQNIINKQMRNSRNLMCLVSMTLVLLACSLSNNKEGLNVDNKKPNVLIILADQWRAQSIGYAGETQVKTPNLDRLASISVNFENAVSGMPVCCPFRASLITGQRPLTHGVFMNDVQLDTTAVSMGKIYTEAGYETGYIGKWHLDGQGRSTFIPPGNRRQGFKFWMANECSHNYNESLYYDNSDTTKRYWDGYDAFPQTEEAIQFMSKKNDTRDPFLMVLAWGTPHAPYHTAPENYKAMYNPEDMVVRANVPEKRSAQVKKDMAGYYAHMTALDDKVGQIMDSLQTKDMLDNTIVLFTSDHGDLLGSHDAYKKQQPYEESLRIPFLVYLPESLDISKGKREAMINSEDILPTLLSLCDIKIPSTVEGIDYRPYLEGKEQQGEVALITCVQPFGQWNRVNHKAREYRAVRTHQYTFARDLKGPWLLFDNQSDPLQMNNVVDDPAFSSEKEQLDQLLSQRLKATDDEFLHGLEYVKKWKYPLNKTETVPYTQ